MVTASYARQSIEKQDSVSIEAQFEKCEILCKLNNWDSVRYSDVGYSGSNIKRPSFEQLIRDIKCGKVNRVITYRLDRISRSITDFANLLQLFEKYNVEYISATENFDTSNPLGRAMVYIVMVFAQLERETITQRITDNYYFRAKQGFFMGGNCPLGYRSVKADVGGKKVSILEVEPVSSDIVKHIFHLFVVEDYNANKVAQCLNESSIKTQKNSSWSRNKVIRILRNPVYTENSPDVYNYFSRKGYIMAQSLDEYTGKNGLGIFGKEKGFGSKRKVADPSQQIIATGNHTPLVSSEIWLNAQHKLSSKKASPRSGTSQTSWLSGLMYCTLCGHSMSIKSLSKANIAYRYFHCRQRSDRGSSTCCNSLYYDLSQLENCIEETLLEKITSKEFIMEIKNIDMVKDSEDSIKKNSLLAKVYTLENEIDAYIEQIGKGTTVIDKYLNQKISELDEDKSSLLKELNEIELKKLTDNKSSLDINYITSIIKKINVRFKEADIDSKKMLATALIKKILLDNEYNITIQWFI